MDAFTQIEAITNCNVIYIQTNFKTCHLLHYYEIAIKKYVMLVMARCKKVI
jgi:hypothetical protein